MIEYLRRSDIATDPTPLLGYSNEIEKFVLFYSAVVGAFTELY
ncbi:MAG: hypothetical protein ACTHKC_06705 [Candidatus Nitrosocosmicus sp.]